MPSPQPNQEVWWVETGVDGMNAMPDVDDQAVLMTYVHDHSLGASDTLNFWTVLTTTRSGTLSNLVYQVKTAKYWYMIVLRGCTPPPPVCCMGHVGNANGLGGDVPTIGDVSVMVDAKFITGNCVKDAGLPTENHIILCLTEADLNQSGGYDPTCEDITIGDISILIDYLFISGPSVVELNHCYQN
jgi:hypothetical protein